MLSLAVLLVSIGACRAWICPTSATSRHSEIFSRNPSQRGGVTVSLHMNTPGGNVPSYANDVLQANITLRNNVTLEFALHTSIASVPADEWNACLPSTASANDADQLGSAFLDHAWIECLEESKCASPQTGWVPQHVSIKLNGQTKGFIPLYIKGNSMGEFIFDSSWADAAYQNKIDYYPKLLVAIPFTPVTAARFLWHPSVYETYNTAEVLQLRRAAAVFLRQMAATNQLSSVHVNFLTDTEATDLVGPLSFGASGDTPSSNGIRGVKKQVKSLLERFSVVKDDYLRRTSLQYHWTNQNAKNKGNPYSSFDDYLTCFKSKKRIKIRRERKKVADEGIRIDTIRGREILKYPGLMQKMFEIYQSTIQKMYWGRQYLTNEFFDKLAESDFVDHLCFMCARYNVSGDALRADDVFAGTFNVVKDGVFYGRYWGCLGKEVKNLHFETCYWSAIEYCIQNGLKRMEPGAGGGDYKWARGFDPALIHSVHYIASPGLRRAISQFVEYETENNLEIAEYLRSRRTTASTLLKDHVV